MKNYDGSVEINHNTNWLCIPNHLYRISIIGGSGLGKINVTELDKKINNQMLKKFIYMSEIHLIHSY